MEEGHWGTNEFCGISHLFRQYIDTPKDHLMGNHFNNDYWGVTNILKAADRRIGNRRLQELKKSFKTDEPAMKVIS